MIKKELLFGIALFLVILVTLVISLNLASAAEYDYELVCRTMGQVIKFSECNPGMADNTCGGTKCQTCTIKIFNETTGSYIYCPASINQCNARGMSCSTIGGNGTTELDTTPPNLTLISPEEGKVYNSRSVLLDLKSNEIADIYYKSIIDNGNTWSPVCVSCLSYNRTRSFTEGLNVLMFRAKDVVDNANYYNVSFTVDSRLPRITKTAPRSGYASGLFEVEFDEANPAKPELIYGNDLTGFSSALLNLSACVPAARGLSCQTYVNLSEYNEGKIEYYFSLTDIAGNSVKSRSTKLKVDTLAPKINSLSYSFDRSIYLILNITEKNLEEVNYIDLSDTSGRARWRKLCSRLTNGICESRVSFSDGPHEIEVLVLDEAGNNATSTTSFFTDTRAPRISRTYPSSGLTNGIFEVEFDEQNPQQLELFYGNQNKSFKSSLLNLSEECSTGRRGYSCQTYVNLTDYNNEEISYWFNLTDILNQTVSSRQTKLI